MSRTSADDLELCAPTEGGKWEDRFSVLKARALTETPSTVTSAPATGTAVRASGHTTEMRYKISKQERQYRLTKLAKDTTNPLRQASFVRKRWLFKYYPSEDNAQLEAAMTAMYRRVSPHTVPKCRVVFDRSSAACVGGVVKIYDNFVDLHDLLKLPTAGAAPLTDDQYAFLNREYKIDLAGFKALDALTQKIEFLVAIGFAEALVMAYYFEDDDRHKKNLAISYEVVKDAAGKAVKRYKLVSIDFDRSAFATWPDSAKRSLAAKPPRKSYDITRHDLDNFPDLRDQDPWYWPTIYRTMTLEHGYSATEAAAFKALKSHKLFRHRMYCMFLRILITPNESYRTDIERHCLNRSLAKALDSHFFNRKKHLRAALVQSGSFQQWWHKLEGSKTIKTIEAALHSGDRVLKSRSSILRVKQRYWNLCRDVAKSHFDEGVCALQRLINSCESGGPLEQELNAMQEAYHEKYQPFLKGRSLPMPTIRDFIRQSNYMIAEVLGICGMSCQADTGAVGSARRMVTSKQKVHINEFYKQMRYGVHQLRQCEHLPPLAKASRFSTTAYGLSSVVINATKKADGYAHVSEMVTTPETRRKELIRQTVHWMCDQSNRRPIERLFSYAMREYEKYTSGGRLAAWIDPGTYNRRSIDDIRDAYGRLTSAKTVCTRLEVLVDVLSDRDWGDGSFNMRLVIALLYKQQRLISTKTVIDQIAAGGIIATEIHGISLPSMTSDSVMAMAFLKKLSQEVITIHRKQGATDVVAAAEAKVEKVAAAKDIEDDWELVELGACEMPAPAR